MKKMMIGLMFLANSLQGIDFPLNQLKDHVEALNIEGGTIPKRYLNDQQIWANLCVVLDRPFDDGVEWQELTDANQYPLKETSIRDYNEAEVNYAYVTLMHHYITKAQEIANLSHESKAKVLIQVHRNTSGPLHINLLEDLWNSCYPEISKIKFERMDRSKYELHSYFFPSLNVEVVFCFGAYPEKLGDLGQYHDFDIVLALSLVAGFNPEYPSGSLLIPISYTPMSLKDMVLRKQNRYEVKNDLVIALNDIIKNQDFRVLDIINSHFRSKNPAKEALFATELKLSSFNAVHQVQVDGMFNPSKLAATFTLD